MWLVLGESILSPHPQTLRSSGNNNLGADDEGDCWITWNRGTCAVMMARWGGVKREGEKEMGGRRGKLLTNQRAMVRSSLKEKISWRRGEALFVRGDEDES
jgi:hypothetical protein